MSNLDEIHSADRRHIILAALQAANGYRLNDSVLLSTIEAGSAPVSMDKLHTELNWLAEQGLVCVTPGEHSWLANITTRGADVAIGRATVPGVDRPRPGAY